MTHVPGSGAYAGSIGANLFSPILLGGKHPVFYPGILKSGTAYKAGTVLGRITAGSVSSAAKSGGNTGNGTLTPDVTTPSKPGVKPGVYQVRFVAAATNNGTFRVTDPDGFDLGQVIMSGGAGAFDNDIKFAIADGATDFVVGDGFDVTVAAGNSKLTIALAAAGDGSDKPCAILLADVDATGGDKTIEVLVEGIVNEDELIYGTGHTKDTVRYLLLEKNILLKALYYSA